MKLHHRNLIFIDKQGNRLSVFTILHLLRRKYGLSRKEIGKLTGVSGRTVEGWFQGRFYPTRASLMLIQHYLELNPLDKFNKA